VAADTGTPEVSPADLPPHDMAAVLALPYPERMRLLARNWAAQVTPNSIALLSMYWLKYLLLFAGTWAFFNSFNAGYEGFFSGWAWTPAAFWKAMVWAIFYESAGFGCAMGPMNGRFWPPFGGFLHFLRPGTIKLPLFPGMPVFGDTSRGWLDVALYAANMGFLINALLAPELSPALLLPSCLLIPLLGITDKTLFLAARGEHYWVALVTITAAMTAGLTWVAGCMMIWGFIWFWAATSKLNHHFPSVIMVMMNNGPFFPKWLKQKLFVDYPEDIRPSRMAAAMAHMGTLAEYSIPLILLTSDSMVVTVLGLILMTGFHSFIAVNNPAGMPVEWNILMVYGGIFLFGANFGVPVSQVTEMPLLFAFLVFMLIAIPLFGNFVPSRVSFLMSMRYYAGNWAYNAWLFRGDASKKLSKIKKAAGTMKEQLERMLDDELMVKSAVAMTPLNRFLHLEGKVLFDAVPEALDSCIDDYEWMDGEVLGGVVLGWNFGDGHLNHEQLLEAVQERCEFEEGELRVVMVESQPLFGSTMAWRVVDAKAGLLAEGKTRISPKRSLQAWPVGETAKAFLRGRAQRAHL